MYWYVVVVLAIGVLVLVRYVLPVWRPLIWPMIWQKDRCAECGTEMQDLGFVHSLDLQTVRHVLRCPNEGCGYEKVLTDMSRVEFDALIQAESMRSHTSPSMF